MAEKSDNNKLTDAERRALMFHHFSAVQIAQNAVNLANEERKRVRKLAKVDGIVLSDLDFMLRCAEIEDPTIITGQIRSMTQIAEWFALPVQYQPDMFVDRAPALERIEAEGLVAGLSGMTGVSEYGAGSPEDQAWMKGWTKGQKSLADDLVSAMEKKKNTISQDNDPGFAGDSEENQPDAAE
ncbi:hypothetical protein FHS21_001302 [Phyllobacterium trifolii]|uniref:Uncharacterized protein n=1 Tax=Phyllobacterium trifolii TaxID=300193 RepID=A0A839U860_9HYPH|nr:hypothetical protein [Phyllobacterium trifolii]MBB3144901.1 hypothetical protein [Phyllobacterium trifolii]